MVVSCIDLAIYATLVAGWFGFKWGPSWTFTPWTNNYDGEENHAMRNGFHWTWFIGLVFAYCVLISSMAGVPTESPVNNLADSDQIAQTRLATAILFPLGLVGWFVNAVMAMRSSNGEVKSA